MEQEIEKVDNSETTLKESEGAEVVKETADDTEEESEGKTKETPEARKARLERQLKRVNKQLGLNTEEKPKPIIEKTKSGELDYGQKAFALQNGMRLEELQHLQETLERTGHPMEKLLNAKWFRAELEEMRGEKATTEATPTSAKRADSTASSKLEYWLDKEELPKDRDLARKVIEARVQREKKKRTLG